MMRGGHEPTKYLSDSDCGAFDHASHAPQSLSDNYYVYVKMCTLNIVYMYMLFTHVHVLFVYNVHKVIFSLFPPLQ